MPSILCTMETELSHISKLSTSVEHKPCSLGSLLLYAKHGLYFNKKTVRQDLCSSIWTLAGTERFSLPVRPLDAGGF